MALTAKYRTTCGVCSGAIEPGAEIVKVGTRWAHLDCGGEATKRSSDPLVVPPAEASGAASGSPAPEAGLEVWTDGACSGNPGPGGWAWATGDGRQDSGGEPHTTNQRMEIHAALAAVTALPGPLVVVSDSTYVVHCFRDSWWRGWLARDWTNTARKPVANRDLWEPLVREVRQRGNISFRWVKGHSGDPMNDLVDQLAVAAGRAVAR